MDDAVTPAITPDEVCTLVCVRSDGVAPFVDLTPWTELAELRWRARRLLREHPSCDAVELWRGGALIERVEAAEPQAQAPSWAGSSSLWAWRTK